MKKVLFKKKKEYSMKKRTNVLSYAAVRAGNFSFYPRVPLRLTRCGTGAGRPFRKIQHVGAGLVDYTRDGCGLVDFESQVPANPQKNKKKSKKFKK